MDAGRSEKMVQVDRAERQEAIIELDAEGRSTDGNVDNIDPNQRQVVSGKSRPGSDVGNADGNTDEDELDAELYQILQQYYNVRSMMKLEILNAWQSSLRAVMLLNLLQVPGFSAFDQTVVTLMGIATNSIAIVKQV